MSCCNMKNLKRGWFCFPWKNVVHSHWAIECNNRGYDFDDHLQKTRNKQINWTVTLQDSILQTSKGNMSNWCTCSECFSHYIFPTIINDFSCSQKTCLVVFLTLSLFVCDEPVSSRWVSDVLLSNESLKTLTQSSPNELSVKNKVHNN